MSATRTKPWEVASGTSQAVASGQPSSVETPHTSSTAGLGNTIPERPTSLSQPDIATSSPYNSYGSTGYGNTGYGSTGYGSTGYGGSRYGSMGGMGGMGSMYGSSYGLGSMYGSGMGGYGMGGYGMNGMGMGMNGMGMNGMDGAGGIAQGTQATFQLIESVIGAVGGFAQMLEATYMATHSSFFTMISVAEQFGHLKQALGGLFGIFALMKYMKKIIAKLSGRKFDYGLSPSEFTKFDAKQKKLEDKQRKKESGPNRPRISLKPLLFFLAAVFGFPYLINKIIKRIGEQQQQQLQASGAVANPASLQFGKALYAFNPENPQVEAALVPGDLVAILTRLDPQGKESPWWRVRKRDGSMGYVPGNYLEIIERKTPALTAPVNDAAVRAQEKQNAFDVNEFKKV